MELLAAFIFAAILIFFFHHLAKCRCAQILQLCFPWWQFSFQFFKAILTSKNLC